jgi:spore maturation protein CgeB
MRILLLGNPGIEHVGSHFQHAASELQIATTFVDATRAYEGSYIGRKIDWWLRGHRPGRMKQVSAEVVRLCREQQPDLLLTTGFAPLHEGALQEIGTLGIPRINYLTDDPWNPIHRTPWFMEALPRYDSVFSPRRANMQDLEASGCRNVEYLPFAYAPHIHYAEPIDEGERRQLESDVIFAGGGDADRVPYIGALREAGFRIALYGEYWDRFPATRNLSRGLIGLGGLRKAMAASKLALCLVRRQNRDGHAMRSFEVPAFGACPLVERTPEHEELFGTGNPAAVAYFDTIPGMVATARRLLADEAERLRMANAAHVLITGNDHAYRHRLLQMVESVGLPSPALPNKLVTNSAL